MLERKSGIASAQSVMVLGFGLALLVWSGSATAQSTPQGAYDQLCGGARGFASPATCAALRSDMATSSAALRLTGAQPQGAEAELFRSLSDRAFVWISPEQIATVILFEWNAEKKVVTFSDSIPGVSPSAQSDLHTLTLDPVGTLKGQRSIYGLKLKLNGRVRSPDSFEIAPYKVGWGAGSLRQRYTLLPSGDLSVVTEQLKEGRWCCSDYAMVYKSVSRTKLAELMPQLVAAGNAFQRDYNRQAAAQEAVKRQERAALFGQLFQGALIVGQSYAAGMQEANQANARSQAIIDAAAESDRQYRGAQAAALVQRGTSQPQSAPPPQQAQTSTGFGAPPAVRPAPTAPPPPQRPAAPPSNASGGGLQPRTVQAYFTWGMALGPNNTRNPRCFSNIFSITYQSAPNGSGDAGRAEGEAGRLASVFRQKCERLGRMDPGTPLAQIALPGVPFSAPYITAEDYRVILP